VNAEFSLLSSGTVVSAAHSDACGRVTFPYVVPGIYYLRETKAPAGYTENPAVYTVVKDEYGFVTINGHPSGGFVVDNKPGKA
jgi:uncharacterized surface anchored protein